MTLTVDGHEAGTTSVRVDNDRLIAISDADRRAWHDTALAARPRADGRRGGAKQWRAGRRVGCSQRLAERGPRPPTRSARARRRPEEARGPASAALACRRPAGGSGGGGGRGNANRDVRARITSMKTQVMASTSAPTAYQTAEATAVADDLEKAVADLNAAITTDVPALAKTLARQLSVAAARRSNRSRRVRAVFITP